MAEVTLPRAPTGLTTRSISNFNTITLHRGKQPLPSQVSTLGSLRGSRTGWRDAPRKHAAHLRCSSAAISISLQTSQQPQPAPSGAANGDGDSGPRSSQAPTGTQRRAKVANLADDEQLLTSVATMASAVAAQYPAVPVLPQPPGSGNLRDVVPYLLGLALQERHLMWRLGAALCCMLTAKLAGISLPRVFKTAVDTLSAGQVSAALIPQALAAVFWYGALDSLRALAKEAQSPIFAPVSQAVTRRVAYHTFSHVLSLDTRFHLDRRTGRVSRILERGTRSIAVLYRALIFTFLPTGIELCVVGWLLASDFGPSLAAILGGTFAAYVAWTVGVTQLATEVRKEVNNLDNMTSSKAVDALLNVETVTLFNNQRLEVGLYDNLLRAFRTAALRAEYLAALLNAGQGLILAFGMAAILGTIVASGTATGGDLVMASGLILQLWAPLQFLGWFYRELRAALVDMEEFFQILRTTSNIRDGEAPLPTTPTSGAATGGVPGPPSSAAEAAPAAAAATEGTAPTFSVRDGQADESQLPTTATTSTSTSSSHVSSNGSSSSSSSDVSNGNSEVSSSSGGDVAGAGAAGFSGRTGLAGGNQGLEVELVDVSFGYSAERQILRGVSLRVAPGESVAVVGSSGSGKSTILKLVTRLYDVWPTSSEAQSTSASSTSTSPSDDSNGANGINGTSNGNRSSTGAGGGDGRGVRQSGLYINGVDVRHLRLHELRSAIAVVPQDTALNYESIRENIRYGRPDASDEEVEAAAKMARLHDTVMGLPEEYDTVVGERGLKMSGGEKQRVAIARAFLRSPRLLICDEATSALDSATEAAIMESLKELATGRSALFVAHRLSTVRNCDRIVVLRNGVVLEEGSHDRLMAKRGEYAKMWELQQASESYGSGASYDDGVTDSDFELEDEASLLEAQASSTPSSSSRDPRVSAGGTTPSSHGSPQQQQQQQSNAPPVAAAANGAVLASKKAIDVVVASTDSVDIDESVSGGGGFSRRAAAAVFATGPRVRGGRRRAAGPAESPAPPPPRT